MLVKKMTKNFLQNEGNKLQFYIKFYAMFSNNYVTKFWERYVYLSARESLLINSSVGHVDVCRPATTSQIQRAAHITYTIALNMIYFNNQKIKPPGDGLVYTGHYKRVNLFVNIF